MMKGTLHLEVIDNYQFIQVADWAIEPEHLDEDYQKCWEGLMKSELNPSL